MSYVEYISTFARALKQYEARRHVESPRIRGPHLTCQNLLLEAEHLKRTSGWSGWSGGGRGGQVRHQWGKVKPCEENFCFSVRPLRLP